MSTEDIPGEIPPCTHRNLPFTRQANGNKSKQVIIRSYISWLNLCKPYIIGIYTLCPKIKIIC
jgi:hypothetical protein